MSHSSRKTRAYSLPFGLALAALPIESSLAQELDTIYRCDAPAGCATGKHCPEGLEGFLVVLTRNGTDGRHASVAISGKSMPADVFTEDKGQLDLKFNQRPGGVAIKSFSMRDDLSGLITMRRVQGATRLVTYAAACRIAAPGTTEANE